MGVLLDKYGKKALDCILDGMSLFITGKAGTGKTTVLHEVTEQCKQNDKNVVIIAPTGVAAKQAGGMTIHSFLHLPIAPYVPGMKMHKIYALKDGNEIEMINQIDIIIIDEVSMVRCDLLDEIDDVLRHYRKSDCPFGGIQVVMFGDLYQLMPVAQEDVWNQLSDHYDSPYFFSSKVMKKIECPMFELKIIHRQDERSFVSLLNDVRLGKVTPSEMEKLTGRYVRNFVPDDNEGYIRLTTHNRKSKWYNNRQLGELPGKIYEYKAYIEDFFPKEEWPTNFVLQLKRGARVMFVRNDNDENKYVNGTLGTVTSLGENTIVVRTDEGKVVDVERFTWDFYRYKINRESKEVESVLCGSFRQYPLKLAWAVTIHKSQGLTFDKVIIDAGRAFTYGQVYVALSRCRRFNGIVLVSKIKKDIIKTDPVVTAYMKSVQTISLEDSEQKHHYNITEKGKSKISDTIKKTLKLLEKGFCPEDISARRSLAVQTIYMHIVTLIEMEYLQVKDFVSQAIYDEVIDAIKSVGTERLSEIKQICDDKITYEEIKMVIADYGLLDDESDSDDEWYFIDKVPFTISSKRFLSTGCRVVLSKKGYYLEVNDEYIKLGNYPAGFKYNQGNVWIKRPVDNKGFRMVHDISGNLHLIGYLCEKKSVIIFTNPDDAEFTITFD